MIKYHSNHFAMASLAHNKKKAIQEWCDRNTQGLPTVATNIIMHYSYVGGV
ncbi:hypothetical protein [Nostoc sp. ChiVER01]|uniref:hypothetical protein n=1 Tax=Nostoc sp. ChiVER01 TaxID=3075382 RepID=UPI002AD1FCD7|nr:hypothetical protein [Nostoc sp. ChiVER01]MDZ8222361.1 hypothetical protein [Nostoc sp. ChiVER01]